MILMIAVSAFRKSDNFTSLSESIDEINCFTFDNYVRPGNYHTLQSESILPDIPSNLLIQDEDSYEKLLQYRRTPCTRPLPAVDFSTKTVLGSYVTGYCGAFSEKSFRRNDKEKTVIFSIVKKENTCRSGKGRWSMNLISVPKIPSDYKINYVVK